MSCFAANRLTFNTDYEIVAHFFKNLRNFKIIMPEQVENWESDENNCSFFIKNLGNLGMKKGSFDVPNRFIFNSNDSSRVSFVMNFYLNPYEKVGYEGYFEICAEMNPMIEMMAKRPLTNFVNILTTNFQTYLTTNYNNVTNQKLT